MARQFIPIESLFFENLIFEYGSKMIEFKTEELMSKYLTYCSQLNINSTHTTFQKLLSGITENDIPFKKNRTCDGNMYQFDLKHIQTILIEKQHIQSQQSVEEQLIISEEEVLNECFDDYFIS
jgi:hypothetical protein